MACEDFYTHIPGLSLLGFPGDADSGQGGEAERIRTVAVL